MKKFVNILICILMIMLITGCEQKQVNKEIVKEKEEIKEEKNAETKEEINEEEKTPKEETKTETPSQPPVQKEEIKCTPMKFSNKYTYVYQDEATCNANGDQPDAFDYFIENGIIASMYGCEKIIDECGNTYYGVYFTNTKAEKYYY